ncbi:MAG: FtsX-like permease family protein [Cellulomonadaceae bacterium]|jgi:putative ABC transport system permease protein|nr:FtsX-like permease family protein [Cellulomonadaceae bacterium]
MFRLTLTQMRRGSARLIAAGIAIVISTAFVAITLLASNVMSATTTTSLAARFADASFVASTTGPQLTDADKAAVQAVPGVEAVTGQATTFQRLDNAGRTVFQAFSPVVTDQRLTPLRLADGAWPSQPHQIALPASTAERLRVEPGGTITLEEMTPVLTADGTPDPSGDWTTQPVTVTVTGTIDDPLGAYVQWGGMGVATAGDMERWFLSGGGGDSTAMTYEDLLIALAPGTAASADTRAALVDAIAQASGTDADTITITTPAEHAEQVAANMTGGQNVAFLVFGLVFAAIALLVAALVIANTFQVLVAQRTRMLALLRCVGAGAGQLRRSVLLEALTLGVVASAVGVALGAALTQLALTLAGGMNLGVPLPGHIEVTRAVVLVPLVLGTVVTMVAALAPARAATQVAPLAALRPMDAPTVSQRAGKVRLVFSLLLLVGGLALLGFGIAVASDQFAGVDTPAEVAVLAATAGGVLSFIGLILSSVFWLPAIVGLAGRLVGLSGPTAKLAAANTLRNPRRTAATSTALVIGVTLVAMMSTGAASARATLDTVLDSQYPIDVLVQTTGITDDGRTQGIPATVRSAITATDGTGPTADLTSTHVTLSGPGVDPSLAGETPFGVFALDPAAGRAVLNDTSLIDGLHAGTVIVPRGIVSMLGHDDVENGDTLTLTGQDGSITVTAHLTDMEGKSFFVVPSDMQTLDATAPLDTIWVSLADGADAPTVVPALQDVISDTGASVMVEGAAVERLQFSTVIDTLLSIVIGLLAAAVIIALIGVANTLSLSVLERQRESATLRAIGLSRGRLRGMLAIEGLLIAGVGAVVGVVVGLGYGWAGSLAILSSMSTVILAVPWTHIIAALVVALAAGFLASVLPGRMAARTSPVEALAAE